MDWLICFMIGHDWVYRCNMDHGTLKNTRTCSTCRKKQEGKYIHDDLHTTWSDVDG